MMWRRLKIFVRHRETCTLHPAVMIAIAVLVSSPVAAAPISVRFTEGVTHGYLIVHSAAGKMLGEGELTQVVKEEVWSKARWSSVLRTVLCTMRP